MDDDDPFNPQARRIAAHVPSRGQLHSYCSYSSGRGSQTSLQPPAQAVSNAPVSEYMYGSSGASPEPRARGEIGLRVQRAQWGGRGQRPAEVPSLQLWDLAGRPLGSI